MNTLTDLFFRSNRNFIPRNSCSSPCVLVMWPNLASMRCTRSVTTVASLWEILLSSTYHTMVHCEPLMLALATHRSYGFKTKPKFCRVSRKRRYHNRGLWTHPYSAFLRCKKRVFFPLSLVVKSA